jgi:hypothetical protein
MNNNKFALVLLFFVVLSCPVFSIQEGCEFTGEFLLGSIDARNKTNPLPWSIGSFAMICLPVVIVWALASDPWFFDDYDEPRNWTAVGAVIGTVVSLSVPLMLKPSQPAVIPDYISEEGLECYIDGYAWRARRTRIGAALIGGAAGWTIALTCIGMWSLLYVWE